MSRIGARLPASCGVALATIVLMLVAVTAASAQGASDPLATPVMSNGVIGEIAPFSGETKIEPASATGILSRDLMAEWTRGLIPTADQIRGLPPVTAPIGRETVIGWDTRMRTYTRGAGIPIMNKATALITFDGGSCTGFLYGPNVVATAGHCVHTGGPNGRWRTNVRVYPGYDAGVVPYGSYPAKWIASVVGWTNSSDERYDYGVVKLFVNASGLTGSFGMTTVIALAEPSIIVGYPGDKSPAKSQWAGADHVGALTERQVFYHTDSFAGQSGSAVWLDRGGPYAYAIHAYGLHGAAPHSNHNHGTRIVQAVLTNYINWRNAP